MTKFVTGEALVGIGLSLHGPAAGTVLPWSLDLRGVTTFGLLTVEPHLSVAVITYAQCSRKNPSLGIHSCVILMTCRRPRHFPPTLTRSYPTK